LESENKDYHKNYKTERTHQEQSGIGQECVFKISCHKIQYQMGATAGRAGNVGKTSERALQSLYIWKIDKV
jgi:hypothetical protein